MFLKMEISNSKPTKCLICYRNSGIAQVVNFTENKMKKSPILSRQLHVIFILKHIFELPASQLAEYIQNCPNVEDWIGSCEKCAVLIDNCKSVYFELLDAAKRFRAVKQNIAEIVKSNNKNHDDDSNKFSKVNLLDITNECRRFISQCKYPAVNNPFIEGDDKARKLGEQRESYSTSLQSSVSQICTDPVTTPTPESNFVMIETYQHPDSEGEDNDTRQNDIIVKKKTEEPQNSKENVVSSHEGDIIIVTDGHHDIQNSQEAIDSRVKDIVKQENKKLQNFEKDIDDFRRDDDADWELESSSSASSESDEPDPSSASENDDVPHDIGKTKTETPSGYSCPSVTKKKPPPPPHNCGLCSKIFPNKRLLMKHMKQHDDVPDANESPSGDNCTIGRKRTRGKPTLTPRNGSVNGVGSTKKIREPSRVQCSVCDMMLYDKSALARHMKQIHGENAGRNFPCKVADCGTFHHDQDSLRKHLSSAHGKTPDLKCQFCNKGFFRRDHLIRHERIHTMAGIRPYQCDICPNNYRRRDKLAHHKRVAHNPTTEKKLPPQHNCGHCSEIFTNKKLLMAHMKQLHPAEMPKPRPRVRNRPSRAKFLSLACPEDNCEVVVTSHAQLEIHFATKHKDKPQFQCSACGQGFYTNEATKGHELKFHPNMKVEKPFTCEHCGSAFRTICSLNSHKKATLRCKLLYQMESEATIVCDQCGRKFGHATSLNAHVKMVHEHEYKFTCEHCGQGFSQTNKLKAHLFVRHKIGDGGPLYLKCPEKGCKKSFYVRKRLDAHLQEHKIKPPYGCDECGKHYNFIFKLKIHKKAIHGRDKKQ